MVILEGFLLKKIGFKFKEETSEVLHFEHIFVWCWGSNISESKSEILWKFWSVVLRRVEKISWADHVRNEEVLQRIKEESNILQTAQRMKANCIDYSLHRICHLNTLSK
jgi:hypothetical protein